MVDQPGLRVVLSTSHVSPGVAFCGRRPERTGSSKGEGGLNLGYGGPDSRAPLPATAVDAPEQIDDA